MRRFISALWVFCLSLSACAESTACRELIYEGMPYTICEAQVGSDLRLFLKDEAGDIFGQFRTVKKSVNASGHELVFAMNAGMYHPNRDPVGLYIENGMQFSKLNMNAGPGNFHLLPNGVFWAGEGKTGVVEAKKFDPAGVTYATQSGPMLVIDNALHPALREGSKSFRVRNGVGQTLEGTVYFVKSELPVNFHSFASLFRDELKTPNALYLDGTVSKLYSQEMGRNDTGQDMGPIIGLVVPLP